MNTKKTFLKNENKPSCLTAVSGCASFKERLLNDFIPRIEVMKEKERLNLHWLIDNDVPLDFIQLSQKYYNYFSQQIKEYQEYSERL